MAEPLLSVTGLTKHFGRRSALTDVSFAQAPGEILGLVGRRGAGKSTLFQLLSGALLPSSGSIYFDGAARRLASRRQAQKLGIATVYQISSLVNRLEVANTLPFGRQAGFPATYQASELVDQFNVAQNLALGREAMLPGGLGIIDWDQTISHAQTLLAEFDLPTDLAGEPASNLNDEQRQIVVLARVLQQPCRLLLLDDIFPALNFQRQDLVLAKIKQLASQGVAVIVSSDDLKHLFSITERILVVYEGRLAADRRTAEVTPREIVELMIGSAQQEQVTPLIWALESYHAAQAQAEELRHTQATLQENLQAQDSLNRQLVERLRDQVAALDQLNAALQATQRRLLTEREEERKVVARELHDQTIQDLLSLNYRLEEIEGGANSAEVQKEIADIRQAIREVVGELRQLCSDLRPPTIDRHGLSAAIDSLAHQWAERNNIELQLEIDPALGRLPEMIELSVFRIIQEGLSNIRKHAEAQHVKLTLKRSSAASLLVHLEDDGQGLTEPANLAALSAQKHFGLVGISERVALLGGVLHIESHQGRGTSLKIEIPSPYPP